MSASADEFFQVALKVLTPVVVKASFDFDFQSIGELLNDDFHEALGGSRRCNIRLPTEGPVNAIKITLGHCSR